MEQLCRNTTRPALANERVQTNAAGQILLKLKTALAGQHMEHCPNCGGRLKIIAAIFEQPVIEKILTHSGCRPGRRHARQLVGRNSDRSSTCGS